jgi:hypothetical protein
MLHWRNSDDDEVCVGMCSCRHMAYTHILVARRGRSAPPEIAVAA